MFGPFGIGNFDIANADPQRKSPIDLEAADRHRAPVEALTQFVFDLLAGPLRLHQHSGNHHQQH